MSGYDDLFKPKKNELLPEEHKVDIVLMCRVCYEQVDEGIVYNSKHKTVKFTHGDHISEYPVNLDFLI